jgi:glycine oxidase
MNNADIAIIGSGLIGRLLALSLHRLGANITLYEQGDKKGTVSAAHAAGGLLTPFSESLIAEKHIVTMGVEGIKLWPLILASLDAFTFFQQQGSLVLAHQQDSGDMQRFVRHLQNHWPQSQLQRLERQQLHELEPELSRRFSSASYLPSEGQIGNRKLLAALTKQLDTEGITWQLAAKVTQVAAHQFNVNGEKQTADLVIDCRGTGAIGELSSLRAVRGELFQLFAPEVNINRPLRLIHPRYNLYIAPKPNHHYVVGATEIESHDTSPMTVRSALELLSAAYSVHSGFSEAQILAQVSATRPALADNAPAIFTRSGLIQINGLYRHGFLLAPVILQHALLAVKQQLNSTVNVAVSHYFPNLIKQAS